MFFLHVQFNAFLKDSEIKNIYICSILFLTINSCHVPSDLCFYFHVQFNAFLKDPEIKLFIGSCF